MSDKIEYQTLYIDKQGAVYNKDGEKVAEKVVQFEDPEAKGPEPEEAKATKEVCEIESVIVSQAENKAYNKLNEISLEFLRALNEIGATNSSCTPINIPAAFGTSAHVQINRLMEKIISFAIEKNKKIISKRAVAQFLKEHEQVVSHTKEAGIMATIHLEKGEDQ
jgi:hypothetical protein